MDRYWLITWTCYGTWLPGARQGFVSHVRDEHGDLVLHNIPGTPYDADMPALEAHARSKMEGPPVSLDQEAAEAMIVQYQETCRIRGCELQAASVMYNHSHRRRGCGRSGSAIDFGNVQELGDAGSEKTSAAAAQRHVLDRQGFQEEAA